MTCPTCGCKRHRVTNSRRGEAPGRLPNAIRRRRQCEACGRRWSTCEVTVEDIGRLIAEAERRTEAAKLLHRLRTLAKQEGI